MVQSGKSLARNGASGVRLTVSIQLSACRVSANAHATPNSQRPVATLHRTLYAHSARCLDPKREWGKPP
ncbi:MAG: hypothetical protein F6K44_13755 [Moorea sp. SIO3E2]|nr:hypothetical protein [Moorena sp. SIO3E2]